MRPANHLLAPRPSVLLLAASALGALLACGGAGGPPSSGATAGAAGPDVPPPPSSSPIAASGAPGAASLDLERLDAAAECDALVPTAAPEPVTVRLTAPAGGTCVAGSADGTGAVALGVRDAAGALTWQARSRDGSPLGTFAAEALVAAPDGWQGLAGAAGTVEHVSIAPDGRVRRASPISPDPALRTGFRSRLAQDPQGGSVVLFRSVTVAGNHWNALDAFRFDASGAPRWPEAVPVSSDPDAAEPYFMAAGVSITGAALMLFQDSAYLRAHWVEPSGAAVADAGEPEASAAVVGEGLSHDVDVAPLLDGGLAVRSDGSWLRRYAPLAARSEPLPAWLAERARWGYRLTRGNAGYAALEPAGVAAPDCVQRIELVAPSGRLCGRITIREGAQGCTTGALDQGWDGTVVQQSGKDACTFRWWPALLARG
ncbi:MULTISPECIES: hypothetical protein [Anaeromyxobacter]|uniref:hypothetical protein n=1 Tax=Anaeromyxobacter TaxID=161492 RepID=UPI001F5774BE|nr:MULTISPECIES: hypothetical protein [unclassified Anaeromyxobacter]